MKIKNPNKIRLSRLLLILIVLSVTILNYTPAAAPPQIINYQGYLVDASGQPLGSKLDGNVFVSDPTNYGIRFTMYTAQTNGQNKWQEDQVVTVDNGYFNVYLGEVVPVNTGQVFSGSDANERYVGIKVDLNGDNDYGNDTEIAPRLRLLASPYSLLSDRAITAEKLASTGAKAEGDLEVVGSSSLSTVTASGTLTVNGNVTLAANTTVGGALSANGNLTVSGSSANFVNATAQDTITANKFEGHGTIPVGGIIMWSGAKKDIPVGWKICDGNNDTPDLSGKFVVGLNEKDDDYSSIGKTGGKDKVKLNIENIPPHRHESYDTIPTNNRGDASVKNTWDTAFSAQAGFSFSSSKWRDTGWAGGKNTTRDKAGVAQDHENRPSYYTIAYIMRVD
mgnify:CR=1 FL=1